MPEPALLESTPFGDSPYLIERFRLANGLTLLLVVDPSAPVFAYQTWFDVGSSNETPGKTGIAHLFEHLLFKATKSMKDGEFDRIMESSGGSTNAATWVDWTYYTSGLPSRPGNLELVARLEADRMTNLILNDAQVEAEREVVLNERRFRVDNSPDGQLSEALYAEAFARHPYHWPTIGWESDIRAITTADCMEFYRVWYAPNNATLVIVGDVDRAEVLSTVQRHYGDIPAQPIPLEAFAEGAGPSGARREIALQIEADKLLVAYRGAALTGEDRAAMQVLDALAFGGNSARVRRALVDELQIAADVGAMLTPFKYPGLLEMRVEMREGHRAEEAEKVLLEELARFASEEVPAEELTKAKNQLELGFLSGLRTGSDRAEMLGSMHVAAGDYRRLFQEMPRVQAVTAADVRRVAASAFAPSARAVVVGRPR